VTAAPARGRLMRWVNRAGTAVIAGVLLLGPPLAGLGWIRAQGWPRPTPVRVRAWFEQPLNPAMIVALIAGIAVVLWLLLASVVLRRAWYTITARIRRLRRLPLPSPAQMTAGSMAGVAAMAMPPASVQQPPASAVPSTISQADLAQPAPETGPSPTASAGIELPGGGWVPYRTALAVTALGALIWLHRRQHYQPRDPRFARHDQDTDLQALPPTVQAITAATGDQPPPPLAPNTTLLPDLPTGLLTLHGPGAVGAARGLLTTAILGSALAGGTPGTLVTVHQRDLELLLGVAAVKDPPAGLQIGDTSTARPPTPAPCHSESGDVPSPPPSPTLVLTRRPGHPAGRPEDDAAIDSFDDVTVVVLGEHRPGGTPWDVAADGTVTSPHSPQPRRLCTLDRQAAADLLQLVRHHARSAAPATAELPAPQPPAHPKPHHQPAAELVLLGGCRLQVHGSTVHPRRSAGLQILAYLAVHGDGATTTDLIRAIWPGLTPNTITKRLHTTLTDLRQQLQPLAPEVILRRGERYQLNPDAIDTDVRRLRRAITAVATAVTPGQQQTAVQDIVTANHGELAAGFSWPWLHPAREALRREVIDAYLHVAAFAPATQAVDLVRAATAVDPYNEALHHRAEQLLHAAGQHDAAAVLRHGLTQRLLTAGLQPPTTTPDSPGQ
jgi:DNA-binding SARP family transcriptional activator